MFYGLGFAKKVLVLRVVLTMSCSWWPSFLGCLMIDLEFCGKLGWFFYTSRLIQYISLASHLMIFNNNNRLVVAWKFILLFTNYQPITIKGIPQPLRTSKSFEEALTTYLKLFVVELDPLGIQICQYFKINFGEVKKYGP
jgi:uncharacterized membrane protein